jgi:hypothetical protein
MVNEMRWYSFSESSQSIKPKLLLLTTSCQKGYIRQT